MPTEGQPVCGHCTFGLIVTGHGERDFLHELFRSLAGKSGCSFRVIRRIGQRNPVTSRARKLTMTGTGKLIPDRDEEDIGLPARRFLRGGKCHFLILIDDLEADRRSMVAQVFERYRIALDTMLQPDEQRRASVHFLANMLEAYYFAHSTAVNQVLGANVLTGDHGGDVEDISHPKNDLKRLYPGFDEREHGAQIMQSLDAEHVLGRVETCSFLRALFGWCVDKLLSNCQVWDARILHCFQLPTGARAAVTRNQ